MFLSVDPPTFLPNDLVGAKMGQKYTKICKDVLIGTILKQPKCSTGSYCFKNCHLSSTRKTFKMCNKGTTGVCVCVCVQPHRAVFSSLLYIWELFGYTLLSMHYPRFRKPLRGPGGAPEQGPRPGSP